MSSRGRGGRSLLSRGSAGVPGAGPPWAPPPTSDCAVLSALYANLFYASLFRIDPTFDPTFPEARQRRVQLGAWSLSPRRASVSSDELGPPTHNSRPGGQQRSLRATLPFSTYLHDTSTPTRSRTRSQNARNLAVDLRSRTSRAGCRPSPRARGGRRRKWGEALPGRESHCRI